MIYANQNDFTKAIELVDKALSIKKDVLYENNKGYYLLNTNKLEEGRKLIDQALQKDKDNAWAVRNIGVYELLKDNSVIAIEYFIKSEKLDPTVELVNFYLGLAYNKSGNKQKACDYWKVGQQLNETKSIEKLREVCK